MERCTTRAEFCQALQAMTETLATEIWTTLVEGSGAGASPAVGVGGVRGWSRTLTVESHLTLTTLH